MLIFLVYLVVLGEKQATLGLGEAGMALNTPPPWIRQCIRLVSIFQRFITS